ncbi:MAG TPA: purine-nucleoside phosphorylase [Bacillota bacterium]|nr:purine-nucleoside phosphorylase [Bacillota bacterium]
MNMTEIKEATQFIKSHTTYQPTIGLILGSGLGVLADDIENPDQLSYEDIPSFPQSTVEGHEGRLVIGTLNGKEVIAMQGRFHYYEGYSMKQVTFPIRVMKQLGVETIVVTNAAGGINESFDPGDLMIIKDQINFTGQNPLIGPNDDELGERFPDMSAPYHKTLIEHANKCAKELSIPVQNGVYIGVTGPTYETPAEIKMFAKMGADAVGMSTVPEVIVANHAKMNVLGISCISNMASGILDEPLSHTEVIETTEKVKANFIRLVKHIVKTL